MLRSRKSEMRTIQILFQIRKTFIFTVSKLKTICIFNSHDRCVRLLLFDAGLFLKTELLLEQVKRGERVFKRYYKYFFYQKQSRPYNRQG